MEQPPTPSPVSVREARIGTAAQVGAVPRAPAPQANAPRSAARIPRAATPPAPDPKAAAPPAPVPPRASRSIRRTEDLRTRLANDLRERLRDGDWAPGEQLPTEADLIAEYGVSRSTVRSALQQLERAGLTITRHGVGTFVSHVGQSIRAGLQELQSMTDTIRAHGMEPRMDYREAELREATAEECAALGGSAPRQVLATTRAVHADGELVAFSYEVIPADLLGPALDPAAVHGSLFALLEAGGVHPRTAIAEIHAVQGEDIGWGERPKGANYLLLRQTHYDADGTPIIASRTYFIEGRFQFSILRVR